MLFADEPGSAVITELAAKSDWSIPELTKLCRARVGRGGRVILDR